MRSRVFFCSLWAPLAFAIAPDSSSSKSTSKSTQGYTFGVPGTSASFDYVIVGGGTAGLVLATRLAENAAISVAVIEAGGFYEADAGNVSVVPAYDILFAGTDPNDTLPAIDWGFATTPQAGANGRVMHYARGKTLGGSSARNFLFYHRPTVGSMQKWADEVGDQSYTFDKLLPFYKKSAHYTPPSITYQNSSNVQTDSAFEASGGPLEVSFGKYEDPYGTWAQRIFELAGQTAIAGFQMGKLLGSAYMPFTEDPTTGHRSSSQSSYLEHAQSKNNLFIYNNTLAEKIIFSGRKNTARGITVTSSSTTYSLLAKREVILSAGVFQSPQLLMVSGIGPAATLSEQSIPLLHDLPGVGQNLWDQPYFGTTYRVDLTTASTAQNNPSLNAEAITSYKTSAAGPLTLGANPLIGWENLPSPSLSPATRKTLTANFPPDWPHLELLPIDDILGNGSNFAKSDPRDGYNYASIATALISPLSRGNISIRTPRMADPPLINPNWLTHPADIEMAIASIKRQRELWKLLGNITVGEEYFPGSGVRSDEEIIEFVRRAVIPIWHAAATCKMGKAEDRMAVVDGKARVYGTRRLRVVDASSFPFLPPGHPQSTVYALAEKIAAEMGGKR